MYSPGKLFRMRSLHVRGLLEGRKCWQGPLGWSRWAKCGEVLVGVKWTGVGAGVGWSGVGGEWGLSESAGGLPLGERLQTGRETWRCSG